MSVMPRYLYLEEYADELYSEIANGRVLTKEFCAHGKLKSFFLHIFTYNTIHMY